MSIEDNIKAYITNSSDDVFLRREFLSFGSQRQVSRVFKNMVDAGDLVKISLGVYAKTAVSSISGRTMPIKPVDVLYGKVLKKMGIEFGPSFLVRLYNSGQSTQIPAGTVLNVGSRRITRKIGFGGRFLKYEYDQDGLNTQ